MTNKELDEERLIEMLAGFKKKMEQLGYSAEYIGIAMAYIIRITDKDWDDRR